MVRSKRLVCRPLRTFEQASFPTDVRTLLSYAVGRNTSSSDYLTCACREHFPTESTLVHERFCYGTVVPPSALFHIVICLAMYVLL